MPSALLGPIERPGSVSSGRLFKLLQYTWILLSGSSCALLSIKKKKLSLRGCFFYLVLLKQSSSVLLRKSQSCQLSWTQVSSKLSSTAPHPVY